jgi:hypothetical protein
VSYTKEINRRYVQWHKEAGLCVKCPEPATHGDMCRKCWMKNKEIKIRYRRKLSEVRAKEGVCANCGVKLDPESDPKVTCINCNMSRLRRERGRNMR